MHRFACAGVGDSVRPEGDGRIAVKTRDGSIPTTPAFVKSTIVNLAAGVQLSFSIAEITTQEQLTAYELLSAFHYRSHEGYGRRAILVMSTTDERFPAFLGFVELATPFLHMKNRSAVLNAPFSDPNQGLSWSKWDLPTRNALTNTVVRVSRIVVHPEVRGLGLSKQLIQTAAQFASERWQVRGIRPVFLEITADMLRFMPFVNGIGLKYIGESGGNLGRLARDMAYLMRASEVRRAASGTQRKEHSVLGGAGRGILSRQRRDLSVVTEALKTADTDLDSLIARAVAGDEGSESLLALLRHPKPSYMAGLTPNATAFLARRSSELGLVHQALEPPPELCVAPPPIHIRKVTVSYVAKTHDVGTTAGAEVRRAFGLTRSFTFTTGARDLTFEISPGDICYITGASGAGKSTLLDVILGKPIRNGNVSGTIRGPRTELICEPIPLAKGLPLIGAIGASSLSAAILALNSAGLAEPRLYLSSYEELSAGQRYRAQLARMICSGRSIWLVDEFASALDDGTALAVARNFAKIARRLGATLILAGVRTFPLVNGLQPDIQLVLSTVGPARLIRYGKGAAHG